MLLKRIQKLNKNEYTGGSILYWMDREMRIKDNWALIHALELAKEHDQPVGIVYSLVSDYLGGGRMQFDFKLGALKEIEATCKEKKIPFVVLTGTDTTKEFVQFTKSHGAGYVVTDFHPLRLNRSWKKDVAKSIGVPMVEVDAHNIVPVWVTSQKQEYAARTIRPKIHKHIKQYLDTFPPLHPPNKRWVGFPKTNWKEVRKIQVNEDVNAQTPFAPGEKAAHKVLKSFIAHRLEGYAVDRNDPTKDALSMLSPYFHYGMIAPQRAVQAVLDSHAPKHDREVFFEEAVVRRELSDNFCYYNTKYDTVSGFPDWAQKTLAKHADDKREYIYTYEEFAVGETHDPLWNAAQKQMTQTGKMHGYMRMYWAKKILEWTRAPQTALRFAIALNDTYSLDGRDPNGYVGVAWSIGGVHDRPWFERPIFGTVRYMNANGCRKKFDVDAYIETWNPEGISKKLL